MSFHVCGNLKDSQFTNYKSIHSDEKLQSQIGTTKENIVINANGYGPYGYYVKLWHAFKNFCGENKIPTKQTLTH